MRPLSRLLATSRASFGRSKLIPNLGLPDLHKSKFEVKNLKQPLDELLPLKEQYLSPIQGSHKKPKRIGRGRSSGHGKTACKGTKGQQKRGTNKKVGFEGGQTPLHRRLPKWGFTKNSPRLGYVNIKKVVYYIERGWLTSGPDNFITLRELVKVGAVSNVKFGVKLLGSGKAELSELKIPIFIEVNDASKQIIDAIKEAGGEVKIKYRTPLKIKEYLNPEKYPLPLADPLPGATVIEKLEKLRRQGCIVEYNIPKWVQKEFDENSEYFTSKERVDWKKLAHEQQKRTKPILPRQYTFTVT